MIHAVSIRMRTILCALFVITIPISAESLTSTTEINLEQAWSQQPSGWTYPMSISVPSTVPPQDGFPVCILLHGNGGTGAPMVNQFREVLPTHALVAPTGYQNSWNICAESSDAPDWDMVGDLVRRLSQFDNIDNDRIQLLGISNGSALVNTVFAVDPSLDVDAFVAVVSHLNDSQYHNEAFHRPGPVTEPSDSWCGYSSSAVPAHRRRYLGMSNINDGIIPYSGGSSPVGVNFLSAEDAIYRIAQSQGFTGEALSGVQPQIPGEQIWEYDYLDGQVVHLRGLAQHGMSPGHFAYAHAFLSQPPLSDCDGDENGDGDVSFADLTQVLAAWGQDTGMSDLLLVLGNWGKCL